MAQYGEIRVDYITYTTGVAPEANRTVTVSSLVNNPVFSGNVIVDGDATVTGDLGVSGESILNDVIVTGDTTLSGNLTTNGDVTISGHIEFAPPSNQIRVGEASDLVPGGTPLNLGLRSTSGISFYTYNMNEVVLIDGSGDTNIGGDLYVSGTTNLNNTTITGAIYVATGLFADGTEASPSISFENDQDTGFYRVSGNTIAITAGGDKKVSIGVNTAFYGDNALYRFAVNSEAHIGNLNTTGIPSVLANNIGGTLFRWNRSAGNAENNIYNVFTGPTGSGAPTSFEFMQLTSGVGGATSGLRIAEMGRFQHYFAIGGNYKYAMNGTGFGAGTINPQDDVDIYSVNPTLRLTDSDQPSYSRIVWDGTTTNRGLFIESDRGDDVDGSRIIFSNDNTPQAYLATSGQFLIKDTYTIRNDLYNGGFGARLQVEGPAHDQSSAALIRNSNNPSSAWLQFGKSRGSTDGDVTITASGDQLGGISFAGADGNGLLNGVIVTANVIDTVSSGNVPAELRISHVVSGVDNRSVELNADEIVAHVPIKELNTSPSGVDTFNQVITEADIGTGPNQIPMNWMLGKDAYSSSKSTDTGFTYLRLGAVTPGSQYVRPLGSSYIGCYYSVIQGRCFVEINSNATITATNKTAYLALDGAAEEDIIVVAGLPLLSYQKNIGTSHRGQIDYTYLSMVIKGWDTTNSAVMFSNGWDLGNVGPAVDGQSQTWYMNTKFIPVAGPTYPRGLPPAINTAELNTNFRDPITSNNQTAYNGWNSYFFIKPRASGTGNGILSELRIRDLWGEGSTGTTITMNARMVGSYEVE